MQIQGNSNSQQGFFISDPVERMRLENQVNANNSSLEIAGRKVKQEMGKEDFLTLLVTQLKNQDPTAPVEDKQFIAQMAQFSSLEQMNNMAADFRMLAGLLGRESATTVLGKQVDVKVGSREVSGVVDQVEMGDNPQIMVNGMYHDFRNVVRVKNN
jgi:flagellar basal-body rod modification protein FlgD